MPDNVKVFKSVEDAIDALDGESYDVGSTGVVWAPTTHQRRRLEATIRALFTERAEAGEVLNILATIKDAEIARLRHGLEAIRDSNPGSAHRIAVQVLEGNPKVVEATCKPSNTD